MDQRSSELNQVEEERLESIENPGVELKPRPATSADVAASERDIEQDLQKLDSDTTTDDSVEPELIK